MDKMFDVQRSGQKAAQLHLLAQAGFQVPSAFVVFFDEDPLSFGDGSLLEAIDAIGGWPVAVRSSGCLEDLPDASFAGQYVSFLNVNNIDELRARIHECRQSAKSARVRTYLSKAGLSEDDAQVSVLVQKMVSSKVSGVGFSIPPHTGKEEFALVECCQGLGEKLVSGRVTPTRYTLSLRDGTIESAEIGSEQAVLSKEEARALSRCLLEIQALYGQPQDVEWAIGKRGDLQILQTRPITTTAWRSDVEELTNADMKDGGVSAKVCTPLMYSLYRNAMQYSFPDYFQRIRLLSKKARPEKWIFYYYGRVYWNASAVKRALTKVPGFDEQKFDQDLGIQKDYPASGPLKVPTNLKTVLRAIPVAFALQSTYRQQLKTVTAFGAPFKAELKAFRERLKEFARTDDIEFYKDLEQVIQRLHSKTEQTYFLTIYNNSNAQTDFKSFLEKMDQKTGHTTPVVDLIGGLSKISHMQMQRGIVALFRVAQTKGLASAEWRHALKTFIEENYFHSDSELDLTVPRWGEDPKRVEKMIKQMLDSGLDPMDPDEKCQEQEKRYQAAVAAVEKRLENSFWLNVRFKSKFHAHLRRVRTYLTAREQMREYSTQCYYLVRQYVLEAGKRLAKAGVLPDAEAIFMLFTEEIVDLVKGVIDITQARELVAFRLKIYQGYRNFTPPNEFGQGVRQRSEDTYVEESEGYKVLKGLGCSPGEVLGVVRVIRSLDEIHLIRPEEILVTQFTDPGWTPVLGIVKGVITEVGGMLSHAAVIGREYGIPAVLNIPGATKVLKTGQRVCVNGSQGKVTILEEVPTKADVKALKWQRAERDEFPTDPFGHFAPSNV